MNTGGLARVARAQWLRVGAAGLALALAATTVSDAEAQGDGARASGEFVAPNPWVVLNGNLPELPPIDATSACFPTEVVGRSPELRGALRGQLGETLEALEQKLASGEEDDWALPVRWILIARTTRDRSERDAAFDALVAMARDFPSGRTQLCFQLEAGRLELLRQNYPEAAAWGRRVEDALGDDDAPGSAELVQSGRFLRAEALYLSGRHPQAQALYEGLEQSEQQTLAMAARLRGADLAADAGRPEAALPRYEELMPRVASFGADSAAWAARVGEAAFQSGEYASALAWFQRHAEQSADSQRRALAEIRVADSAAILGKLRESRALLRDITEYVTDPAIRDLASVRMAVPPVGSRKPGEELERLERAAESPNPRVSQYARAELGRGFLEGGEADRALEVFTRLAFEVPDPKLAPWLDVHLAEAIEAVAAHAVSNEGCHKIIGVIGWRREFLLRHSDRAKPFLQLGECYEEAGLPGQAIHLYRSLVRRFGARVSEDVSLPLARAALGAGELGVARAAARARVEAGAGAAWSLLLAGVYVAEGLDRKALETLRALLETGDQGTAARGEAIWLYAVLAVRADELESARPTLAAADPWLGPDAGLSEARRGDVLWARAEASRVAGLMAPARRDYRAASALLALGPRRASAEYWLGVLEDDPELERRHYSAGQGTEAGGLWGTLAGEELALSELRKRYGRPGALRR